MQINESQPEIIIFGHEKKTFAGYNSIRLPLYSDP